MYQQLINRLWRGGANLSRPLGNGLEAVHLSQNCYILWLIESSATPLHGEDEWQNTSTLGCGSLF
jgi:hypothetical protein